MRLSCHGCVISTKYPGCANIYYLLFVLGVFFLTLLAFLFGILRGVTMYALSYVNVFVEFALIMC